MQSQNYSLWHLGSGASKLISDQQLFIYSVAVVDIVSMATGKTLITHSFEVGKSKYLVQMFLGRVAVAKRIFMLNINFVRLGIKEF